jgi:hypothetical protein
MPLEHDILPAGAPSPATEQPASPAAAEPEAIRSEIQQSDPDMIRVYEDLVDVLMAKNMVLLTDFPPAAQAKLLRRKQMRAMLAPLSDILAPDEDQGIP